MIIAQEISVLVGVAPASQSAAEHDGTGIDFSETYEPDCAVALVCGVLGASATAVAALQDSPDNSTWTTRATTHTAVKATDDGTVWVATAHVVQRYVRAIVTVGTATSVCGAVVLAKRRTIS